MDNGDFVVVTNIEKIKFTGKKFKNKKYYKHTGHPGGIKTTSPSRLMIKKPEDVLSPRILNKYKKLEYWKYPDSPYLEQYGKQ